MRSSARSNFVKRLTSVQREVLLHATELARQTPSADWTAWGTSNRHLGLLPKERVNLLAEILNLRKSANHRLVWDTDELSVSARSEILQFALERFREMDLIPGWRNEAFSFWTTDDAKADINTPHFLSVERSGFRLLGMMSHAVHINGFLHDGSIWCGQRSTQKATDPGMLDNLTAGGIPTGETVEACAFRELQEECGLVLHHFSQLQVCGTVRISNSSSQVWHDETLHVFNLDLGDDFLPANRDGEVSGFLCLEPGDVVDRIVQGEFTLDATLALVHGIKNELDFVAK